MNTGGGSIIANGTNFNPGVIELDSSPGSGGGENSLNGTDPNYTRKGGDGNVIVVYGHCGY